MTSAHILTRTPQGPFLLDASASTAVWRERRSSLNVWDFVPNDQRSGSRASDTGIPGSGTTTVTVGRASPCRGAAPRRSPPMCSQYSAAEFPQRGDNPGNLAGFEPARVAGSRAADSSGRQGAGGLAADNRTSPPHRNRRRPVCWPLGSWLARSWIGSGVDRGRHLDLGRPSADHDQRHHQREYREDGRELEGGRDAVGQHLVGVLRRKLTGLLELGLELGGGVGQELSDLGGGLVAAGGAEHGNQDG